MVAAMAFSVRAIAVPMDLACLLDLLLGMKGYG